MGSYLKFHTNDRAIVTLADWFHFMWDRLRGIRKDITQQALCCEDSIRLVEMCARFHAHCAARLADLEHTQFDQKLNTDNLTKCLQTLKHMYADVRREHRPREAEFRGYIALLNLGDANFWWEIKQLPDDIQKSEPIIFAVKVFTALDNNNYVRFFRLVRDEATYLQACILLRYFNDVRARALARIVKAYAPRGGSKYPAEELMNTLAFETIDSMKSFVNHYGLRFSKTDFELTVILDRNQFIEDSDPYPVSRAFSLIESKRKNTVAEIVSGGNLPHYDYKNHSLHTSFNPDGKLKESSLTAEDLGYNTMNDSSKDIGSLKMELQRLASGGKSLTADKKVFEIKKTSFVKPAAMTPPKPLNTIMPFNKMNGEKTFSFQPALAIDLPESIKKSPETIADDAKRLFTFSPPQESQANARDSKIFTSTNRNSITTRCPPSKTSDHHSNAFKSTSTGSVFAQYSSTDTENKISGMPSKSLFANSANTNVFAKKDEQQTIFSNTINKNIFSKPSESHTNIFAKTSTENKLTHPTSVFRSFTKPSTDPNPFSKEVTFIDSAFPALSNGETTNLSPGTLFKQANDPFSSQNKPSIFQSNNKSSTVASNIFNSVKTSQANDIYEFSDDLNTSPPDDLQQIDEQKKLEEAIEEQERKEFEEKKRKDLERKREEIKRQEEALKEQEELKRLEEIRKKEEQRKQAELKKKLEEERQAEINRKAKEQEKIFKENVDKESQILVEELVNEVNSEIVSSMMKEEIQKLKNLVTCAEKITDEILTELLEETCRAEIEAEIFWTRKLMKKWFHVWRKQIMRNFKRRRLLEDTPVWLTDKTPLEEAQCLRRLSEKAALSHMNAIHRGYTFKGELKEIPLPKPYNLVEIIRSPLLKRMKQIHYPYDKCFFWKVTVVTPGTAKWFCKKINITSWLLHAFRDKGNNSVENLIHIEKQSWNNLMDFAISVTLINQDNPHIAEDALEGTNGVIFYMCHDDFNIENIEKVLKQKYAYHIVPIAVITTPITNAVIQSDLHEKLSQHVKNEVISDFRIYVVDTTNLANSLDTSTKSALKWLAKRSPNPPPLEIDTLKSICQRYLGNEIWHRLKTDKDIRVQDVMKDIRKLVQYYNTAVEKLTEVITDESLFNYPAFPIEFKNYLDYSTPCPKPYEFIPNCLRNTENTSSIKNIMQNLKLCNPNLPKSILNMQDQVHQYCNQIGWFKNPEEVACKVVALLPNQFSDNNTSCDSFNNFFDQYNLVDMVNIIVYEKMTCLKNFDKQYAMYHKSVMKDYNEVNWLYDIDVISSMKHKADESEDDLDDFIKAKRRKIDDSFEYLALEDKDCSMVQDTLQSVDRSISKCNSCKKVVTELEKQLNEGKKKSDELENLLWLALNDV